MSTITVEQAEQIEATLGYADGPPPGVRAHDETIETVSASDDGWQIVTKEHTGAFIAKREMEWDAKFDPQPGDTITLYTEGMSSVAGFALNGKLMYLLSEREMNLKWLSFRAKLRRQRLERFEIEKVELDRKYAELPASLKARIDRFRAADPEFRAEAEAYEMAAVYDAPKIAVALAGREGWSLDGNLFADQSVKDVEEAVQAFRDLDYEQQKELVPTLDPGHSGNTFGAATMLAFRVLAGLEC
jgi:hypothetical protein